MSTENSTFKHVSSSPHLRNPLTTGGVMLNVIIGLLPATIFGIWHFGLYSAAVILASIAAAVATEYIFNLVTKRPNTVTDCSAVLTGLLLALCLPSRSPLYVPIIGSVFGILVAKCFFGGLGQNFMNPALAGRAFLLISFGKVMTDYSYDAVSSVTPLATFNGGEPVSLLDMFIGNATGHIGISVLCILIGGIWLLATDTISWEIPVASTLSFWFFLLIMGGHGFDPYYLAVEFCGGGFALGAFFMATDPVTNPMTWTGQIIFGVLYGFLSAVFRTKGGMADTTSFAIIIANMATPLIDRMPVPQPFGVGRKGASVIPSLEELAHPKKKGIPKSAIILMAITLVAGGGLACVNMMTADTIAENERQAALA
ncbi:MAG: RnfABCDGE type electron transport complex subunit D, partial [Lachnospiraceae bacterium]|nr:RnfABCDGE type electron transport complex subunit D [Lachnospiraceae bacterium]